MIFVGFAVALVLGTLGLAFFLGRAGFPARSVFESALRIGLPLAVARIALLWVAVFLLEFSDWRQVAGYFLLVLNCLVEMQFVTSMTEVPYAWALAVSAIVLASSVGYAAVLTAGASCFKATASKTRKAPRPGR